VQQGAYAVAVGEERRQQIGADMAGRASDGNELGGARGDFDHGVIV